MQIPDEHRDALRSLLELSASDFESLIRSLESASPSVEGVVNAFESTVEDASTAAAAVLAFSTWRTSHDRSFDDALGSLRSSLELESVPEGLSRLLNARPLTIIAKAIDLGVSHERVFQSARVMSDMRPIFGENVEEPPIAAVVTHELLLNVYGGASGEELYVSLDSSDVKALRAQLDRALEKQTQLEMLIVKSGMAVVDLGAQQSGDGAR
ncbi:hypothetical protein [Nocardioides lentus]|uniref:hypothetical protein n=1 Tax=Nocardioides lentus TaxID=338077 RepID=UPI0031D2D075